MADNFKTSGKAYMTALVGLLFGVVGAHRFYLEMNFTGMLMLLIFLGGVFCLGIGYVQMLSPLLTAVTSIGVEGAQALPTDGLISHESKGYFIVGSLLCLAALCWLAVDLLTMPMLTKKANAKMR